MCINNKNFLNLSFKLSVMKLIKTVKDFLKPKAKSKYIILKSSRIHNKGVFARINIPKGTKIIEYVGDKITKKESDRRAELALERAKYKKNKGAVYIFTLNKKYDIDGDVPYNTAKYINHSCNPNCETEIIDNQIWISAIKNIKKGEELSYDYGYDIDNYKEHPCKCGSKNCPGYIVSEEQRPKLEKILKNKNKKISKN